MQQFIFFLLFELFGKATKNFNSTGYDVTSSWKRLTLCSTGSQLGLPVAYDSTAPVMPRATFTGTKPDDDDGGEDDGDDDDDDGDDDDDDDGDDDDDDDDDGARTFLPDS